VATPSATDKDQFALIAEYYDTLMANVPYDVWADYVSELAHAAGRPILPGMKLLDLATGTGSVAIQFAKRGCLVTGIDLSAAMIEVAKRKAAEMHLPANFHCRDLANFEFSPEFDHAVCLYDSLNYILESKALEQTFANIRRSLRPGALLIFDINTVHALEAELFTQTSRPDAPIKYHWKSQYDPASRTSRIDMRFRLPDTGKRISIVHQQRAYTDAELRSLMHRARLTDISAYDAYRMTPPGPMSDRVFYVARCADTA